MRKIFMILTLIVSSFFIFNTNVKADTIYEVSASNFDYINDVFYTIRDKAIEFATTNNQYYIISFEYPIVVWFFDKGDYAINYNSGINQIYIDINSTVKKYRLVDGNLTLSNSLSSNSFTIVYRNSLSYLNFLDTNVEKFNYIGTMPFTIKYNDLSYSIEQGDSIPSLYQIYLDENPPEEPPIEDDEVIVDESLNSFYSLVMEKIQLFANSFISNNILLFVIGIFILIFIIELIRRYLL